MSIAFVFPGQGSQVVGMGLDLFESSAAARSIFEQADQTLDFSVSNLCFEGPEAQLTATEFAQPALLTVSTAILAALKEQAGANAPQAAFVAGHSLGEYSALVAAGALPFASALRLVQRRGQLMAQADSGGMAAIIGLDEEPLEAICREVSTADAAVVIANYNSPGQLVISGANSAIERACEAAKAAGARRALPLKVSAAFHSPLMQAAGDALAPDIAKAPIVNAAIPVVANVNAELIQSAEAIRAELTQQVTASVRWIASVRAMAEAGVDTFIEIGPGSVLTGLIKRIAPEASLVNINNQASLEAYLNA